jgi:predicted O-methyltransferase YrrM
MDRQETLELLRQRFNLDYNKTSPYIIECSRFDKLLQLFGELGFKKGAEIGVFRGLYSNDLITRIPDIENLIGVDSWQNYGTYLMSDMRPDMAKAYAEASEIYSRYGSKATMIRGWSTDVAKTIPDGSLDFVFIDANHTYEFVVADIAAWDPKVRKGGIIYGHDFRDLSMMQHRSMYMHVVDAVTGWTKSHKIHPWFVLTGNRTPCWMYVKQ